MSQIVLTLAGVAFQDFEIPEKIQFGGGQRLAVNELIGGGRVVNPLGADDGEIIFRGIFSGDDASARAQLLDAARAIGAAIPLVWGEFFYSVVLAEFAAAFTKPWWIPFALRCVVVSDPVSALASFVTPAIDLIGADLSAATSLSGLAGISLDSLGGGSIAGFAAAQSGIAGAISTQGAAVTGAAAGINGAADAASGTAALGQLSAASAQLAGVTGLNGYVNRAAANILGQIA
jgi:hypothetical protein